MAKTIMMQLCELERAVKEFLDDLDTGGYNSNARIGKLKRLVKWKK